MTHEWKDEAPTENGDFFYSGPLPDGVPPVVAIVQVYTDPTTQEKHACLFIPPNWRGNGERNAMVHCAELSKWKGQWAGPEHGLCSCEG